MEKSSSDHQPTNETSSTTTSVPTAAPNNNEVEDDYIECSLETVLVVSPPHRPCVSQQTDNDDTREIINEFILLKNQYSQTKQIQYELILNYHETILKVITSLQQSNQAHQDQIEQLQAEIVNHIQDNETLKIQYDVSETIKTRINIKIFDT